MLVALAHSANIKERRDCSTALFDPAGEMVMQAEHIPVHLGAMPAAVAAVARRRPRARPRLGPQRPVSPAAPTCPTSPSSPPRSPATTLIGFAASRAHHADVGGRVPGSMPADSHTLDEEGVVIAPRVLDAEAIDELVAQMRNPSQRRADLRAQLAANATGVARLTELAERIGVRAPRGRDGGGLRLRRAPHPRLHRRDAATASATRATCSRGATATSSCALTATVAGDAPDARLHRSAPQDAGNLNCPLAVTRSACLFAVRVLTDPDIPPCAGAQRPITVIAPEGSLLNARPPAAVAAGNVETSSRVADLVLAAFGRALGQGTMNNLTLGNDAFTYYETLGGGQGACPDADGPSGVHVAMSNTLNTPIEALELEFPLRVTRYALRRGSGGAGRQRGGDGVVRELEALAGDDLLADHRTPPPRAAGRRRRRARRPGPQPAQRRRARAEGDGDPAPGRPPDARDPRRRRARRRLRPP